MYQEPTKESEDLAKAILDIVPKVGRRVHADIPLEGELLEIYPNLRAVSELRATPGQLTLLKILAEHGRCMMQGLAEHLAVTPSTATAMVKRLLAQGYVERSRDDVDWRAVWVSLTERGLQVITSYDRARLFYLRLRLERLSEDEHDNLIAALPALHHLIED
jgi:DNA-binding MarR family transcriptional regulator